MDSYMVRLVGKTPLLMHADNIEWADTMEAWKNDPANKNLSKAGDDRTPPFRWLGSLYHNGQRLVMPADNVMRCLMEGGTLVPVPGGKGGKTFKAQTQSGCISEDVHWRFLVNGNEIPTAPLLSGYEDPKRTFDDYQKLVAEYGFMLYVKRARIGQQKHIRVRPRFDSWVCEGTIHVADTQITGDVLRMCLENAGRYKGLGDWRPGAKTPGPHGMFTVEVS